MVTAARLSLVLFVVVLGTACTGKKSQRTEHQGPVVPYRENPMNLPQARNAVQQVYHQRQSISERINKATTADQLLQIALELEPTVLSPTVLADPALSGRVEYDTSLSLFHRALSMALDKDRTLVSKSGILGRYEVAALAGCTADNRGCIRLPVFRSDHLTGRILMRIAEDLEASIQEGRQTREEIMKRPADQQEALRATEATYFDRVTRYYRLLQLAYEMSNGRAAPELDQKYVNFSKDYFEYFRALPAESKKHEFHRRHRDTLTLALGAVRNRAKSGTTNEQYCRFIMDLNPLDMEAFDRSDMDKRGLRTMLHEFVECSVQKGQFQRMISDFVDKKATHSVARFKRDQQDPASRNKVMDEGYAYALAALEDTPFLTRNLGIETRKPNDLPFFILEKVFYQQIDLNMALAYWQRVERVDDQEFIKFVRNYARVQTAYVIKATLLKFGAIMKERFEKKGGLGSDFFADVIKDVNSAAIGDWDILKERLLFVKEFIVKIYDAKYNRRVGNSLAQTHKEYTKLVSELNDFPEHVTQAVVSPMNLALYYYMAKAQGTIKFHVPWWRSANQWFDIQGSDALSRYLNPGFRDAEPFFKFGALEQRISELQKLHVFDYALRIGVFDFIDFALLDEDKAVSRHGEVLFFKQVFKDMLLAYERSFENALQDMEVLERNRQFRGSFLGACEDPIHAPVSFSFSDIYYSTFLKDPGLTNPVAALKDGSRFINAWRTQRDDLMRLVKLLEHHMNGDKADQRLSPEKFRERQAILAAAVADVEKLNKMERDLFSRIIRLDKLVVNEQRDCLVRLQKFEFLRKSEVLKANVDFYKSVHAAMSVLNAQPQSLEDLTVEQAAANFRNFAATNSLNQDVVNRGLRVLQTLAQTGLVDSLGFETALNELFKVHNITEAPYNQIGFLITGIPTYAMEKKRVKSLNYFSRSEFSQGKWDSLTRVRRMIQITPVEAAKVNAALGTAYTGTPMIGPNVSVPLGSFGELESMTEYTANTVKHVRYTADQTQFVRAAMVQFAGAETGGSQFISWYSPGGLDIRVVESRLSWLKDLMEFGTIELADTDPEKCGKDKWGRVIPVKDIAGNWLPGAAKNEECKAIRVSALDVMDQYLKILDVLRISDDERELLDWMERTGRLEDIIKAYLAYRDEPSTAKWTYFDQFYRRMYTTVAAQNRLGRTLQIDQIRGADSFSNFRDAYLNEVEEASPLFAMREMPTQVLRDQIRESTVRHLDEVMEFEEAVYDLEQSRYNLGDYWISKTTTPRADEPRSADGWRLMKISTRNAGPRAGTPIYLRDQDSAKSWFASYVEAFIVKESLCTFLPTNSDPDHVGLGNGDCLEKFSNWHKHREQLRLTLRRNRQRATDKQE